MTRHPQLQRFVDDEIERAPLLIDEVMHLALDASRTRLAGEPPLDARAALDLQAALQLRRDQIIRSFTASLKEQVDEPAEAAAGSAGSLPLSLLDESAVETDVQISHTVDAIASVAEYELRELGAYTSALVGDVYVAQHTNPLHAVVYARALWAAANVLPRAQGLQLRFMRHASMPLAQALRKAYAAACRRLDDAGVAPGKHRTIVLHAGTRTVAPADEPSAPVDLPQLRDTMPVPLDAPAAPAPAAQERPTIDELLRRASERLRGLPSGADTAVYAQAIDSQRMSLLGGASTRADQQAIELLARLFDTMLGSRTLEPAAKQLLTALHAPILSVALHDPRVLEAYGHPVWRFIDRIAFITALHPRADDPLRARLLHFVGTLVDNISREPKPEPALFEWGLERLAALERHLFELRLREAAAHVAVLQGQESADAATQAPGDATEAVAALDVSSLLTVPAALLDDGGVADDAAHSDATDDWAAEHRPGQWVLVFLQRDWRVAQLLWRSESGELWLYAEASDLPTWALRRRALERLHAERLLHLMQPRSLVRKAADSVLRGIAAPG